MNKFTLTPFAIAICFAVSTGASAADMTKSQYKAAKEEISVKYKADKTACKQMNGNAKDICMVEAKGAEKIALAELVETNSPSDKHRHDLNVVKADAAYAIAKEKCDDKTGNAKDICRKEAKRAHVSALADATLEKKTDAANETARDATADARKDATADKRDAAYAVAKEKCEAMVDDAKATCMKDAKARFGQS